MSAQTTAGGDAAGVLQMGPSRQRRTDRTGWGFVAPFAVVYVAFLVIPAFMVLVLSFTDASLGGQGLGSFLGLTNYEDLAGDAEMWSSLLHTVQFTLLSTPPLVLIGLVMALLANRSLHGRWLLRLAYFAPFVLPVSVVVLIWTWLYQPSFGLINSWLQSFGFESVNWLTGSGPTAMISVVATTVWWTSGLNFLLYLAALQDIPEVLYEAADVDGATGWQKLRHITLPMLKRTTLLVVVLQILASLKVFDQIYLMTEGGPNFGTRPIIQYIYEAGFTNYRVGFASAVSWMFFLLILVASLAQLRSSRPGGGRA
jgi:multiple sugar transport system permease protein